MRDYRETIRLKLRKRFILKTSNIRVKKLMNRDFTIISNNCWGGFVYQSYGLPYLTPTIGLFFMAEDFLKFTSDLHYYINYGKVKIIPHIHSKWNDALKEKANWGTYPIGKLNDIEIHFLHYKSDDECIMKWDKRSKRINWNNVIIKYNDQNMATEEHLMQYQRMELKNKLLFVCKKNNMPGAVLIPQPSKYPTVMASYEPIGTSKVLNITDYLNSI